MNLLPIETEREAMPCLARCGNCKFIDRTMYFYEATTWLNVDTNTWVTHFNNPACHRCGWHAIESYQTNERCQ